MRPFLPAIILATFGPGLVSIFALWMLQTFPIEQVAMAVIALLGVLLVVLALLFWRGLRVARPRAAKAWAAMSPSERKLTWIVMLAPIAIFGGVYWCVIDNSAATATSILLVVAINVGLLVLLGRAKS